MTESKQAEAAEGTAAGGAKGVVIDSPIITEDMAGVNFPVQLSLSLPVGRSLDKWERAGLATVPYRPNSKAAVCTGWQVRDPSDQWSEVAERGILDPNIALLLRDVSSFDADAGLTADQLRNYFDCLGARLPETSTATPGHRQLFARVSDMPADISRHKLSSHLDGDFLAAGAALVPRSIIDGRNYGFRYGNEQAVARAPVIGWRDVSMLVDYRPRPAITYTSTPVPLISRPMPRWVAGLFYDLQKAAKGQDLELPGKKYQTRSEAEMAVVCGLILAGWGFDTIRAQFQAYKPGHYQAYGGGDSRHRDSYFAKSFDKALTFLCNQRREFSEVYQLASLTAWPGRFGYHDRAVYLALLSLCWLGASWDCYAAFRELRQLCAKHDKAIGNALKRLQDGGLIAKLPGNMTSNTGIYRLAPPLGSDIDIAYITALPGTPGRCCVGVAYITGLPGTSGDEKQTDKAESGKEAKPPGAQRGSASLPGAVVGEMGAKMGRTPLAVYDLLGVEPLTVADLVERTGKHRVTIWRNVKRLIAFGLAERVEGGYVLGPGNLEEIARETGAYGAAERRRHGIDVERRAYKVARQKPVASD